MKFYVTTQQLEIKRQSPSAQMGVHRDPHCHLMRGANTTELDGNFEKAIINSGSPCKICNKESLPKQNGSVKVIKKADPVDFVPPKECPTIVEIKLPAHNSPEIFIINGIKYLREDTTTNKKDIKGIILLADGKEYNII